MNWDQIEQKWEEMARRIQPVSALRSTGQSKPPMDEADVPLAKDAMASNQLHVSAVASKPIE